MRRGADPARPGGIGIALTVLALAIPALASLPLPAVGGGPARAEQPAADQDRGSRTVPTPGPTAGPTLGPARAIGGYAGGCLAGAVALPPDGPGFSTLRRWRNRYYGHPVLIAFVTDLGAWTAAAGHGRLLIGDLVQPRGGPMPDGHVSHQNGLDIDIRFQLGGEMPPDPARRRDGAELSMLTADRSRLHPGRWTPAQAAVLRRAATRPGVERIFVNPVIKRALCRDPGPGDRAWLGRLRPWYGHHAHFHVRLACPADSPDCRGQPPVKPGDGCGATLDWWFSDAVTTRRHPATPSRGARRTARTIELPPACAAVLAAP